MNRVEQLREIQSEALQLFEKKNADYGDAFAKYGLIGVLMRIEDKIQRSLSITKNGVNLVNDETIKDTLLDLHNYAAMGLMLLSENNLEVNKNNCCMCRQEIKIINAFIPSICKIQNGEKAHRICKECWWHKDYGFSREDTSHKCPGCLKSLPLTNVNIEKLSVYLLYNDY